MDAPDGLYFRQIAAGPMQNFVYALGCTRTRKAVLVDPAWSVESVKWLRAIEAPKQFDATLDLP